MKKPELSCTKRQEEAINHKDGPAMVLAGPGSGKTFVTVHRIHRLITSQGVDPAHILVITFTKAAALEMQERFFRLSEKLLPVRFGTFHALFYYILRQSAQYRGHTIITETEKRKLIRDIIHNHRRFAYLQEEDMEEVLAAVSRYKTGMAESQAQDRKTGTTESRVQDSKTGTAESWAQNRKEETAQKQVRLGRAKAAGKTEEEEKPEPAGNMPQIQKMKQEDFLFLLREYQSWLAEFSKFDFDDLMTACLQLLQEDGDCLSAWQAQFRYILVDEFQDISPVQYEIVKLLAAPGNNLFIVGDDDQSIYGFRGASPDSMQQFLADFGQAKQILLDVNFRCHEKVVQAAGRVIGENENRIPKQILSAHADGEGVLLCPAPSREKLQEAVAAAMKKEQAAGKLSDCAMICRTNLDCGFWAQTLHDAGVPYVLKEKPQNRFSHFVVRDICAYLALGQGDHSRHNFFRVMNRPVRYIRRDSLPSEQVEREAWIAYYSDTPVIQARIIRLYKDIENLAGKRLHLQIHYIRKVIGYEAYLREKYGSEKAEELIKIGEEFEAFSRQFSSLQEMKAYMEESAQAINEPAADQTGVRLLTMHASKGLEFGTVFLPDCNEGKIPSEQAKTQAETEEERRMFYVAMTRAKNRLFLFFQNGKTGKDAPSRFLSPLLS